MAVEGDRYMVAEGDGCWLLKEMADDKKIELEEKEVDGPESLNSSSWGKKNLEKFDLEKPALKSLKRSLMVKKKVVWSSIAGKEKLEMSDIESTLEALKDKLMTKNVADNIAQELCESVAASLVGKKLPSFTGISSIVKDAMHDAIARTIMVSKSMSDTLRDAYAAKKKEKPYVVVIVGAKGVGKSTILPKLAYWFLDNGLSVFIADCDTSRPYTSFQLQVDAHILRVIIFNIYRVYKDEPAIVAKEAIHLARDLGKDVVLVNTTGIMQDDEPEMRALSKLICVNSPDRILFVQEARLGNYGVDELLNFNQKLRDLSPSPNPKLVDGILLSKFDKLIAKKRDRKDFLVVAALSMAYSSGASVLFVGCGKSNSLMKYHKFIEIRGTQLLQRRWPGNFF